MGTGVRTRGQIQDMNGSERSNRDGNGDEVVNEDGIGEGGREVKMRKKP